MSFIDVAGLAFGYPGHPIGEDLDLQIRRGEVLCLLGPNGSGKTSLLKCLLGLLPAAAGHIAVGGSDIARWPVAQRARLLAHVPQSVDASFAFTVFDMVLMGRIARLGPFGHPGRLDREAAAAALDRLGIGHLAGRVFTGISGGERQMVLIARALAQETAAILMDEPTAALDFANQDRVLSIIADLQRSGLTVIFTTHHPDHAFAVADRVALLRRGRIIHQGLVGTTLTAANLSALYGTPVTVATVGDRQVCLAGGRAPGRG